MENYLQLWAGSVIIYIHESTIEDFCLLSDPSFCAEKDDGFYSDPNSCQGFIDCTNGVGTKEFCLDGQFWNDEIKECEVSSNVQCQIGIPRRFVFLSIAFLFFPKYVGKKLENRGSFIPPPPNHPPTHHPPTPKKVTVAPLQYDY